MRVLCRPSSHARGIASDKGLDTITFMSKRPSFTCRLTGRHILHLPTGSFVSAAARFGHGSSLGKSQTGPRCGQGSQLQRRGAEQDGGGKAGLCGRQDELRGAKSVSETWPKGRSVPQRRVATACLEDDAACEPHSAPRHSTPPTR